MTDSSPELPLAFADIAAAADRLRGLTVETPLLEVRPDGLSGHMSRCHFAEVREVIETEDVRAAGAELVATDTPPKVTISEYVDVAKAFYPTGREAGFVNGVLDHMARAARPEAF